MWERTLTLGSAGKSFSVCGWKCGWVYGPDYLIRNAMIAHQNNVYCHSTPIQVKQYFNHSLSSLSFQLGYNTYTGTMCRKHWLYVSKEK